MLTCDRLGSVAVVRFEGEKVVIEVGTPAPPGTRLVLRTDGEELVQGKVTSVAADRPKSDRWELTVKLFGPSKAARAELGERVEKG